MLLRSLNRFRMARTTDLISLFFPSVRRDTANGRLRRLFDAGYLDVRVADRTDDNLYSLGPRGRDWIREQGATVGFRPRGQIAHHLAIVQAWTELAAWSSSFSDLDLRLFRPDWELRPHLTGVSPLVPDALVELQFRPANQDARLLRLAVEVDLGTERTAILRDKIAKYRAVLATPGGLLGWTSFGLAVVLGDYSPRHQSSIARILDESWGNDWIGWPKARGFRAAIPQVLALLETPLATPPNDHPLRKGS